MLQILLVEDNPKLRVALKTGLEATRDVRVVHDCDSGGAALTFCLEHSPDAILMDAHAPMNLLEPAEQGVARLLAQGLTNEQIAARSATDEKIARTRAALIACEGRLMRWDAEGVARALNERGEWAEA